MWGRGPEMGEKNDCDGVLKALEVVNTMMEHEQCTGRMAGRSLGQSGVVFPHLAKLQVSLR